jgi:cytochrome P450
MPTDSMRSPQGPSESYNASWDLLKWLEYQRAQFGDIYKAIIYGRDVYVVSDPEYVLHILRANWQNYRKGLAARRVGLLLGPGLISSEGAFWKSQRRLIQPAFNHNVISGFKKVIVDANVALLSEWERAAQKKVSVNATHDISFMVLEIVLSSIFGEDYRTAANHFGIIAEEWTRDLQFAQRFRPLHKAVIQIAAQRRAEHRTDVDFLGILMAARDRDSGEAMSDGQLATEIMTLIVAGHETTALTLNWTWYLLAKNPNVEAKLSDELSGLPADELPDFGDLSKSNYVSQVVEEALRLYPPVWLITRKAVDDDYLGDYFVPAGTEIYLSPYIIQRHPDLWRAPEQFDPDRFSPDQSKGRHSLAMHPFSAGPRNCIGEALARFEMQIHLMMIARKLRMRCSDDRPLDLDPGVNLRNKFDFILQPQLK